MPIRSAYFSVRCIAKGVRPFHNERTPSCSMICLPQFHMPAGTPVLKAKNACGRQRQRERRHHKFEELTSMRVLKHPGTLFKGSQQQQVQTRECGRTVISIDFI